MLASCGVPILDRSVDAAGLQNDDGRVNLGRRGPEPVRAVLPGQELVDDRNEPRKIDATRDLGHRHPTEELAIALALRAGDAGSGRTVKVEGAEVLIDER